MMEVSKLKERAVRYIAHAMNNAVDDCWWSATSDLKEALEAVIILKAAREAEMADKPAIEREVIANGEN